MMAESPLVSRDGISKTAKTYRDRAAQNGHRMTQEQAERRVRDALRKSNPTRRD